ncbi:MAG: hypothetical protein RIT81_26740 [Deltaproteobacteria bacterium]
MKFEILHRPLVAKLRPPSPSPRDDAEPALRPGRHFVQGAPGMGKTSLLRALSRSEGTTLVMGGDPGAGQEIADWCRSARGTDTLLVDDFDILYDARLEKTLRSIPDARLVATSRSSRDDVAERDWVNRRQNEIHQFDRYFMELPTEDDTRAALTDLFGELSEDVWTNLFGATDGHPTLLARASRRPELFDDRAELSDYLRLNATSFVADAVEWVFEYARPAAGVLGSLVDEVTAKPDLDEDTIQPLLRCGLVRREAGRLRLVAPQVTQKLAASQLQKCLDAEAAHDPLAQGARARPVEEPASRPVANPTVPTPSPTVVAHGLQPDPVRPNDRGIVTDNGRVLTFRGTNWRILYCLVQARGEPVSVATLKDACGVATDTAIRSALQQIRARIERENFQMPFENVPRRGYAIAPQFLGRTSPSQAGPQSARKKQEPSSRASAKPRAHSQG